MAVLVDVDRDRRFLLQRPAALVACTERLLDVFDPERRELRYRIQRLLERPRLVDVDLQRQIGDGAHRSDALHVEAVPRAELQLEPAKSGRRSFGASGHVVRVAEPHRPRRRRPHPRQAEQAPRRHAEELALEIVQRRVDRRLRSLLVTGFSQSCEDLLERERVVAHQLTVRLDESQRRRGRFVIPLDRRSFAVAGDAVVRDRDVDDIREIGRLARDVESLSESKLDDLGADLHEPAAYCAAIETT